MSFKCSNGLRNLLNGHTSKNNWSEIMNTALGPDRVIKCWRDASSSAPDPASTGVLFRSVGSTGSLKVIGGVITGLGRIKGSTVKLAADMSTGRSVMRVEGNGHWFEGTLGLSMEAQRAMGVAEADLKQYDFVVSGNFTQTNGLGVKPSLAISGPRFSPSGVGSAAPALTANAPRFVEVWNWSNQSSPSLAGTLDISLRDDDMVCEDQYQQLEIGDVAVYRTQVSVPMGDIEFGATLLVADKHNRDDHASNPTEPLYQLLVPMAVRQSVWAGYPYRDNHNRSLHSTYPVPHKLVVKNAAGTVLGTIQMHDGKPVNHTRSLPGMRSATQAAIPNVHTGMMHTWENIRPRLSSRANKVYAGMIPDYQRPSVAKHPWSVNGIEAIQGYGYGQWATDGLQHLYGTPRWPMPREYYSPTVVDPYLTGDFTRSGAKAEMANGFSGWDYEPGSFTGHNHYTGPGGPRFDRGPIGSAIALMLTFPNGNRLQDNVPWRDIGHAYIRAFANHGNHWVDDVNLMTLGGKNGAEMVENVRLAQHYYGGDDSHPGKKVINSYGQMREATSFSQSDFLDKNNQLVWGGWARDGLHSYGSAAWGAIAENNPAAMVLSRWDTGWQLMANPGIDESGTNGWFYRGNFMVRDHAWLMLQYTLGRRMAGKHRLQISKEKIMAMVTRHLEDLHRSHYNQYHGGSNEDYFVSLRAKGQPWIDNETKGGALGTYMGPVIALMVQTGFWQELMAQGGKVAQMLTMMVECFDKYVYDILLTSSMRYYPFQFPNPDDPSDQGPQGWPSVYAGPAATWADIFPPNRGQLDLVTNRDGSYINLPDVSCHPFLAWPYMRRDYLTSIPNPRTADACAKVDMLLGKIKAQVDAKTNPGDKRGVDLAQGYPGIAPWKAPLQIGPA